MYILLLFSMVMLWYLQDKMYRRNWSKNLSVKLKFQENYIYEGDESSLKEIVVNDKRFPVPAIDVRLAVNRNLKFISNARENSTVSDQTYKRDVFSFVGRQKITRTLRFVGEKRGLYEFKDVDVTAYDFFLNSAGIKAFPQNVSIFVYPSPVSVDRINLICQDISGMIISQNKLNPDPFEFYGIREYVNTDPINYINWKASVRSGSLMVNQFDSTTNVNLRMILDVEDKNIWKNDKLIEECIRIAASLAAKIASKNMPLSLSSNGIDYECGEPIELFLPIGGEKIMQLNQKLACVDIENVEMTCAMLLENSAKSVNDNNTYIFISKNYSEEIIAQLQLLTQNGSSILWIMPQYVYEESITCEVNGVKLLRWEVA